MPATSDKTALASSNNPGGGVISAPPAFGAPTALNSFTSSVAAPAKPVAAISTEQGQNVLAKTVAQATKLSGAAPVTPAPVTPVKTDTTQQVITPVVTTTTPTTKTDTTAVPSQTKVTLINPATEQTITFNDASLNKDNIQQYMNSGYQLSDATGTIPDWLTPTGVAAPTNTSSALATSNAALAQAKNDVDSATTALKNLSANIGNDPQLQTILSGIGASWDKRVSDLTATEDSRIAALTTTGIRLGSQYTGGAGGMTGSIISAEEKAKISEIGDLQNQKQQALAAAQQAFETNKWTQYNDLVQVAQKAYDSQVTATQKLQDAQTAQDAALQKQQQAATTDSAIAKLYAAGTTNAADILAGLRKGGDTTTTLDDINKSITALTPPGIPDLVKTVSANGAPASVVQSILKSGDLNAAYAAAGDYASGGTGIVGEYNFYKAQATAAGQTPMDFNSYQTMDANRKAPAASTGADTVGSLAQGLVNGYVAPSELSKRSTGVGSYSDILAAADAYSMQTTGKHFDIAKADQNYKFANNPATQNTLNFLGSLIGSDDGTGNITGGNLDTLLATSKQLAASTGNFGVNSSGVYNTQGGKGTPLPSINDATQWAKIETGNAELPGYYAQMLEVSDQIAKILQGGGSGSGTSDAKLAQAQALFQKGFTANQMANVLESIKPLLISRAQSMVKDNPYLSDYATQFGLQQDNGKVSTGQQAIQQETAAQSKVKAYIAANPAKKDEISSRIQALETANGGPITTVDFLQAFPEYGQ